jgi:hypothetical protein
MSSFQVRHQIIDNIATEYPSLNMLIILLILK